MHTTTNRPTEAPAAAPTSRRSGLPLWVRVVAQLAAGILAAGVLSFGYVTGTLGTVLGGAAIGGALLALGSRAIGAGTGALETGVFRRPWRRTRPWHLAQLVNRLIFWPLVGFAAARSVITAALPPPQVRIGEIVGWAAIGVLMLSALLPRRRIMVVSNVVMLVVSAFLAVQFVRLAMPVIDAVALDSPVRGDWYVGSGGRSVLLNHHYPLAQQRDAVDISIAHPGAAVSSDPRTFPAFGQTVYAPADGAVVAVQDQFPDLPVGASDRVHPAGNNVVLQIGRERYVLMAHLQQGSVAVTVGQQVRRGEPLARVGNSGNTSEPHLHLQVQSGPALMTADSRGWTRDLHTFPIELRDTVRIRGGERTAPAQDLRGNDLLHSS
jgi:hypothetical protein